MPSCSRSCADILVAMTPEKMGPSIGAAFGLGFVLANTGALPSAVALSLRVLGVATFVAVFVMLRRRRSLPRSVPPASGSSLRSGLLARRGRGGRSHRGWVSPVQRAAAHSAG